MKSWQRKTANYNSDSLLLSAMGCIESTPEQAGLWDRYEFRANIGDGASSTVFMGAKQVRKTNAIELFFQLIEFPPICLVQKINFKPV